jgi:hypothetical protein
VVQVDGEVEMAGDEEGSELVERSDDRVGDAGAEAVAQEVRHFNVMRLVHRALLPHDSPEPQTVRHNATALSFPSIPSDPNVKSSIRYARVNWTSMVKYRVI